MGITNIFMKNIRWFIVFLLIFLVFYLAYLINKPIMNKKQNTSLQKEPSDDLTSDDLTSDDTIKCETSPPRINNMDMDMSKDIDRQYLVDEDPELLPANEVNKTNYKGWQNEEGKCKGEMNEELYTDDNPLFDLKGPVNLVPLDLNGEHRRVNFY